MAAFVLMCDVSGGRRKRVNAKDRVLGRVHSACQSVEYPLFKEITGNSDI